MTTIVAPMDDALCGMWERLGWVEADPPDDPFMP